MATATERLQIIIEALNLSKDEMKRLQKDLEGTSERGDESRKSVGGLEGSLGSLAKRIAVGIGIASLGRKFADFTKQSITLAARVETLGVVTAQLGENVGMTESEIRSLEESIQAQGITTRKSREAVAQMIQAEIDLAEATDIARLAQNAAVIAGTNSSEAFDRLVSIIARGNTRMARNLGLIVDFEGAYQKLADQLGKTTDELTKQERIQARTNEVMEAGENITGSYEAAMETAGKQMGSYARHFEELQVSFGKLFQTQFKQAIPFVTNVTDRLKAWSDAGSAVSDVQKEINLQMEEGEITTEQWKERVIRANAAESAWGKAKLLLGMRIREFNDLTDEQIEKIFGLTRAQIDGIEAAEGVEDSARRVAIAQALQRDETLSLTEASEEYEESINNVSIKLDDFTDSSLRAMFFNQKLKDSMEDGIIDPTELAGLVDMANMMNFELPEGFRKTVENFNTLKGSVDNLDGSLTDLFRFDGALIDVGLHLQATQNVTRNVNVNVNQRNRSGSSFQGRGVVEDIVEDSLRDLGPLRGGP